MSYVAVLPFVLPEIKDACLATCKLDRLLVIDNSVNNLGIMRSHNLGIDVMREHDVDWLVILSAALRFGEAGGVDFVAALERDHVGSHVVKAEGLFGWHMMAFSRECIETIGRWDENFSPYGWDDSDVAIRVWKGIDRPVWSSIFADVDDKEVGMGHSIRQGGVRVDNAHHLNYFAWKWGRPPGVDFPEYHDRPFGDPDHAVGFWPPISGARWNRPCPDDSWENARWR